MRKTDRLPYSIRILIESAIRNCDNFQVKKEDVEKIIDWENTAPKQVEIPFKPARVLLQVSRHSTCPLFCYIFHNFPRSVISLNNMPIVFFS